MLAPLRVSSLACSSAAADAVATSALNASTSTGPPPTDAAAAEAAAADDASGGSSEMASRRPVRLGICSSAASSRRRGGNATCAGASAAPPTAPPPTFTGDEALNTAVDPDGTAITHARRSCSGGTPSNEAVAVRKPTPTTPATSAVDLDGASVARKKSAGTETVTVVGMSPDEGPGVVLEVPDKDRVCVDDGVASADAETAALPVAS